MKRLLNVSHYLFVRGLSTIYGRPADRGKAAGAGEQVVVLMVIVLIALAALLPVVVAGISLLVICGDTERKISDRLQLRLANKDARTSSTTATESEKRQYLLVLRRKNRNRLKQRQLAAFELQQLFLQRKAAAKSR